MTKTAGRPQQGTPVSGPTQQDLRTAYQVHTLAHMLYGQLASVPPWVNPSPYVGAMGVTPPVMGPTPVPWAQGWPATYGGPFGGVGPMGFHWTGPGCYFGSEFFPR